MGIIALFIGLFGGACGIVSLVAAVRNSPVGGKAFTEMFWLELAGVLFLACIALLLGGREQY